MKIVRITGLGVVMEPRLLNMEQALDNYRHLHIAKPKFGMDVVSESITPKDIVILQNDGTKQTGRPVRFNFYTMILCLRGGSIRHVNQYTYTIKTHTLQLLPPGTIHSFEDTHEQAEYYVLLFERSSISLNSIMSFHNKNFNPVELDTNLFQKVKELYEEMDAELKNKKTGFMTYLEMLLGQLVLILQREKLKLITPETQTRADLICSQFLNLVEENFLTLKHVSEYAKIIKLTPKHLGETIKKKLGKSALYFIHKRIIREAEYLLVYTGMNIDTIASQLNFQDASQFSRFFKKHQGVSPKSFRILIEIKNPSFESPI
jgi:AraC family transcriptional activator of pobA